MKVYAARSERKKILIDYDEIRTTICRNFCNRDPYVLKEDKKVMCNGCVMQNFTFANRDIPLKEYFQNYNHCLKVKISRKY